MRSVKQMLDIASKKIEAFIRSMKFLSPEFALYLYKSTIRPCLEYCCHVWASAPSCSFELLDKLQKQIYRTTVPLLYLLNPWHIIKIYPASIFSIGITLVYVHLNCLKWFQFLILKRALLIILIGCMIFLWPFLDVTRMSKSTVSFLTQLECGILCQ